MARQRKSRNDGARMKRGDKSLQQGQDFIIFQTERLVIAATRSDEPLLFYAGTVAALTGHVACALGKESADAIMEVVRPILAQEASRLERESAH